MSYESPIKIGYEAEPEEGWADKIGKYIAGEVDSLVLESCVKVGCHVDKDELEKTLRYDRDQYDRGYADGKRDAASPWHRVEDELPEIGKIVLVYDDWDRLSICKLDKQYRWLRQGGGWFDVPYVRYWMPIEPPKED